MGATSRGVPRLVQDDSEMMAAAGKVNSNSGFMSHSPRELKRYNSVDCDKQKKTDSGKKVKKKRIKKRRAPDITNGEIKNDDPFKCAESVKSKKRNKRTNPDQNYRKSKTNIEWSHRPDPEGGDYEEHQMDEYDRIIYGNSRLFSDVELSDADFAPTDPTRPKRYQGGRKQPDGIRLPCALGINSGSMLRFSIIEGELKNIMKGALRMCEDEIKGFTRRIQLLEDDLERTQAKLDEALLKLEDASKTADESERGRKVLESRSIADDDRIDQLEKQVKDAKYVAEEADRKYDEAARKLAITEVDLERAETRLEAAEAKITELSEELQVVGNNSKALQNAVDQASQREDSYEETIRDLTQRLKDAENRAAEAERVVNKLQKEVDRLEDELLHEKEKYKQISDELDQTFAELAGM